MLREDRRSSCEIRVCASFIHMRQRFMSRFSSAVIWVLLCLACFAAGSNFDAPLIGYYELEW